MQHERVAQYNTEMQHDATPHMQVSVRRGMMRVALCNTGNMFGNVLYTGTLEMQHIYVSPLPTWAERVALEIQHHATTNPAT